MVATTLGLINLTIWTSGIVSKPLIVLFALVPFWISGNWLLEMWSNLPHNTQPASRRCGAWTFTPNPCGDEGRRHRQWGKFRECRQCVLWNYADVCWNTFLSDRLLTMEANEFVKPLKLVFIIGWISQYILFFGRQW